MFAKAPTGIGKTISTLFPSVKAIGRACCRGFLSDGQDDHPNHRGGSHGAYGTSRTLHAHGHADGEGQDLFPGGRRVRWARLLGGYYDRINGAHTGFALE